MREVFCATIHRKTNGFLLTAHTSDKETYRQEENCYVISDLAELIKKVAEVFSCEIRGIAVLQPCLAPPLPPAKAEEIETEAF